MPLRAKCHDARNVSELMGDHFMVLDQDCKKCDFLDQGALL